MLPPDADQNPCEPPPYRSPYLRQAAIQSSAVFFILSLAWPYYIIRGEALPWAETSLLIGGTALLLSSLMRQTWWWRFIHGLFTPGICWLSAFPIPPGWYLLAFLLLFFVYRGALSGQIPLFLSNHQTCSAVVALLAKRSQTRVLDIGAGTGSFVRRLGENLKSIRMTGVENAFIPWLIGYFMTRKLDNVEWLMHNFWQLSLTDYDVVYAFLSPIPMPDLWKKIQNEMLPGSLFISNSFPVPGQDISFLVEVDDSRKTRLYCYEIEDSPR